MFWLINKCSNVVEQNRFLPISNKQIIHFHHVFMKNNQGMIQILKKSFEMRVVDLFLVKTCFLFQYTVIQQRNNVLRSFNTEGKLLLATKCK